MKASKTLEFRYALAKTLRGHRNLIKKTQEQLAKDCEVTQACIAQWETGVRIPSLFEFYRLRIALNIEDEDYAFWESLKSSVPEV